MFHQDSYDLMRQRYKEHNQKLNQLYAPVEVKPGAVKRALDGLRGLLARRSDSSHSRRIHSASKGIKRASAC
jgi:hypothetical protein